MDRFSISQRLVGGFSALGVMVVVMAVLAIFAIQGLGSKFTSLTEGFEAFNSVAAVQEDLTEARMHAFAWRATVEPHHAEEVQANIDEIIEMVPTLRESEFFQADEIQQLQLGSQRYAELFAALVDGDASASQPLDDLGPDLMALVEEKYERIQQHVDALSAEFEAAQAATIWRLVFAGLVAVALAGILAVFILRSLTGPLGQLIARIRGLAEGDYDGAVPCLSLRDRLGEMAQSQEALRSRLSEARSIQADNEARSEEQLRRGAALEGLIGEFRDEVERSTTSLSGAGDQLKQAAQSLSGLTETAERKVVSVASSSEESSASVQTVASSAEELAASISEILRAARDTSQGVLGATEVSSQARSELEAMSEAVNGMSDVLSAINGVAEQTNLLALNATIEAARAGDAGKGFAVVASEVKALAEQTQKLTEQIGTQIDELKNRSESVSGGAAKIGDALITIQEQATATTSTAEQQTAAVQEISSSAQEAAGGASQSSASVMEISDAVASAAGEARSVEQVADDVVTRSSELRERIAIFLDAVKAA